MMIALRNTFIVTVQCGGDSAKDRSNCVMSMTRSHVNVLQTRAGSKVYILGLISGPADPRANGSAAAEWSLTSSTPHHGAVAASHGHRRPRRPRSPIAINYIAKSKSMDYFFRFRS